MSIFICSKCDAQYPKWQGRCQECQSWGTVKETADFKKTSVRKQTPALGSEDLQSLGDVSPLQSVRISSGLSEIDKVLGGGLVLGSLILLGGQPGIGKSTLVLQTAASLVKNDRTVFYFSGEESKEQIKLRADRLQLDLEKLKISLTTNLDVIISTLIKYKPALAVIDSIQTVWTSEAEGTAGGTAQVRASTTKLLETAKQHGITILIIGHVTKDGSVAGPKTLEHLVDAVLYLEGERLESVRLARVVKNRFGPSGEVGVLAMTARGLEGIKNSGRVFLGSGNPSAGSSVGAIIDGSRVFLTDVDVLLEKSLGQYPKRTVIGFDSNKLQVLLAILHRHAKLNLGLFDVYVHLPGGLKSSSPSLDLAICFALASSKLDRPLSEKTLAVAEVGLNGNLRPVSGQAKIVQEAAALGFKKIIIAQGEKKIVSQKISVQEFATITAAVKGAFGT